MLDTNICIHLMQQHPPEVLARIAQLQLGDAVMSVITYAELRFGVSRMSAATGEAAQADQALAQLIEDIPVLPFDESAGVSYGVLRAAVRDRQRNALDRLIAAHALAERLTLVTNNEADFKAYPGLTLENWIG
ncbi:MAG: type II toxin-antitoxin system VapC family toxin [Hyphomonadaceae bacterium]